MPQGATVPHAVGMLRNPSDRSYVLALDLSFSRLKLAADESEEGGLSGP